MALAPYSARPISTRSCGSSGSEYTAMSQARLAESSSAIWSGAGADQLGQRVVGALQRRRRLGRRLVAAGAGLALEVPDHGVEHRLGEQRCAGVVEVQHLLAPGREGPRPVDVDAHPPSYDLGI